MITRLEIENFKAIRKVAIDLTPLTVLVGPNDSGKTTILQALQIIGQSLTWRGDERLLGSDPRALFGDPSQPLRITVELQPRATLSGPLRYLISFQIVDGAMRLVEERLTAGPDSFLSVADRRMRIQAREGGWPGMSTVLGSESHQFKIEPYLTLWRELPSFYCSFEPPKMVAPAEADAELASTGAGLAGVLDRLLTAPERDEVMAKFNATLRRLSPSVHTISMRPAEARNAAGVTAKGKELLFTLPDRKTAIPAREASTGLVLIAGYLALMHGTTHRRFLVEEPENGVHPQAILTVVDLLRELAANERQVIATTHSPILLNYMEPEDVQIVTRTPADGVTVTPMARSRFFKEDTQRADLGELWYSVGDDAMVSTAR